jgi:hypothetical protein
MGVDWDEWDRQAAARKAAAEAARLARPKWKRAGGWILAWTVGLVVSLLIAGVLVALMTSWNPAGGQ